MMYLFELKKIYILFLLFLIYSVKFYLQIFILNMHILIKFSALFFSNNVYILNNSLTLNFIFIIILNSLQIEKYSVENYTFNVKNIKMSKFWLIKFKLFLKNKILKDKR